MPPPSNLPLSLRLLPPPAAPLNTTESTQAANLTHLLSDLTEAYKASSNSLASPAAQFASGHGFPPIPKKLADRILAGEFVDLADLPPAKGKVRPLSTPEGSVLLVHAHDFIQQKRLIPDLATWVQSFSLYTAVLCSKSPERLTDMLGYMCQITRASQRFKWPSWVIYDQNFRQEAADRDIKVWSQMDPSLFAQCFTGQAKGTESWCKTCHSLDHSSDLCPLKPPVNKRPRSSTYPSPPQETCKRYNKFNGNCNFGNRCRYAHKCLKCSGDHPASACSKKQAIPQSTED